jgi:hypothetical protein
VLPEDFAPRHLRAWFLLSKDEEKDDVTALAACGLATIEQHYGPEVCRRFLSSMLGPQRSRDVRGWLADVMHPASARLRDAIGEDGGAFVGKWRASVLAAKKITAAPK